MTVEVKSKIEALKYAISVCDYRRLTANDPGCMFACDDIKIFLEAAIERLEHGEQMAGLAYTQNLKTPATHGLTFTPKLDCVSVDGCKATTETLAHGLNSLNVKP